MSANLDQIERAYKINIAKYDAAIMLGDQVMADYIAATLDRAAAALQKDHSPAEAAEMLIGWQRDLLEAA